MKNMTNPFHLPGFHSKETGKIHAKLFIGIGLPNRATCIWNSFISLKEQFQ